MQPPSPSVSSSPTATPMVCASSTSDKSNWIGKALVFPRALLPQVKARPWLAQTGQCSRPICFFFNSCSRTEYKR